MVDYSNIFKDLFIKLKESELRRDKQLIFTNKNKEICAGFLRFNDKDANLSFNGNYYTTVHINNETIEVFHGYNKRQIKKYTLEEILNTKKNITSIFDYIIKATNNMIEENKKQCVYNDSILLKNRIKGLLQDKVSIGLLGNEKNKLVGVFMKDPDATSLKNGIDFTILYDKKQFLILYAESGNYPDRLITLGELGIVISSIVNDVRAIGQPTTFYNLENCPCLEWKFTNKNIDLKEITDKDIEYVYEYQRDENNLAKSLVKKKYYCLDGSK